MPAPRIEVRRPIHAAIAALALAASCCFGPGAAFAIDESAAPVIGADAAVQPAFLWNAFFAGLRSAPQPGGDPALEGGVAAALSGRGDEFLPADFYVGYQKKLDGVTFGATALYVSQPPAGETALLQDLPHASYWRFRAGASASPIEGMTLGVNLRYTPDRPFHAEGEALPDLAVAGLDSFAHNAHGGYPTGAANTEGDDLRYDVGVSFNLPHQYKLDLRYYKTLEGPLNACGSECPTNFAAALQRKF